MVVREGLNVSLQCAATGSPPPTISWRREDGELITLGNGQESEFIFQPTNTFSYPIASQIMPRLGINFTEILLTLLVSLQNVCTYIN